MSRSKREIPHYYLAVEIPLERASEWLTRTNAQRAVAGRILLAAVLIKATAAAARKYPEMNGYYRDGRFEPSAEVNVGVAISLRQGGLIAPALIDTDRKTIEQVMAELTDLVKRARAFSLRASELSRPTLTLTNLGDQGVELVQGVIYPPQVALVGFGKPTQRAWVESNSLRLIPAITASLAADHRVSDGHRGALFLAAVRDLLQAPEQL
jgi:pyruvate dehydrogenase E2 component (dihydrolipoamide acetyltransferase)